MHYFIISGYIDNFYMQRLLQSKENYRHYGIFQNTSRLGETIFGKTEGRGAEETKGNTNTVKPE